MFEALLLHFGALFLIGFFGTLVLLLFVKVVLVMIGLTTLTGVHVENGQVAKPVPPPLPRRNGESV